MTVACTTLEIGKQHLKYRLPPCVYTSSVGMTVYFHLSAAAHLAPEGGKMSK